VHPRVVTQVVASDHTSLQRWASELPRVPRPRTSPPCLGELRCCHVSCGPGPRLLTESSSGAATCSSAPDLASLPRWAPALPCPMALGSPSPKGELRRCHVFLSSEPRLPAEVGSSAATWPRPRLPVRRAPVLPRTPRPPSDCGPQE
jgi:hypothetical protein